MTGWCGCRPTAAPGRTPPTGGRPSCRCRPGTGRAEKKDKIELIFSETKIDDSDYLFVSGEELLLPPVHVVTDEDEGDAVPPKLLSEHVHRIDVVRDLDGRLEMGKETFCTKSRLC